VLDERNVDLTVYEVPILLHDQNADAIICEKLGLSTPEPDLADWKGMLAVAANPDATVEVAIVGAHHAMSDSYKSVSEALFHGGVANRARIVRREVDSTRITPENVGEILAGVSCVLVPDGAGKLGCDGALAAIRWARENRIPFLGIGLGMELAALEFARDGAGIPDATHAGLEDSADLSRAVMTRIDAEGAPTRERSTFRKGLYACALGKNTRLRQAYGDAEFVRERHRNEYELNPLLLGRMTSAGMTVSGFNPDSQLVEAFELADHPWFVGVIYHPEFKSRPVAPHPLFRAFVGAAIGR
jgi:CTP synthase